METARTRPSKEGSSDKPTLVPPTMASLKERGRDWFARHNALACVCIAILVFLALAGLFAFVAFSDFGGSADFIYNQF